MLAVAETQATGKSCAAATAAAKAALSSAAEIFLFHEVLLGEIVIGARDGVDELVACSLGGVREVGGDIAHGRLAARVRVRLHREQVDNAAELVLRADGQLHGDDLRAERFPQESEGVVEIGALAVQHVADDDAAEPARRGAIPEPLVLDLDAEHRVDDDDGGLDDPQGGDGVGEEARVAGRVDEVERETVAVDVRQTRREAIWRFFSSSSQSDLVVPSATEPSRV